MSKRDNTLIISDIDQSIDKIFTYINNLYKEEFLVDNKTQDAVSRNFEIIGEASSRLSKEFKEVHSEINWTKLKDFRNKIIHDYFGTDYSTVWLIIKNDLKFLQKKLSEILKKISEES